MDNSVIISDQVIDGKSNGKEATIPKKNLIERKQLVKCKIFIFC